MIRRVTAFSAHQTGVGMQIAFTYSEIDGNGKVLAQNKRAEVVVLDETILKNVDDIFDFLQNKIPE